MKFTFCHYKNDVLKTVLACFFCLFSVLQSSAQDLKVAVAANLQGVIKVLQKDFLRRTGIRIEPIIGSSGNLTNQIKNGAPFDIFLSADMNFPQQLYKGGFAASQPTVYALGSLIICSKHYIALNSWEQLLQRGSIHKIAVANPQTAPYGKAATEVLQKKNLLQKIKSKLVYGESISQVNTYITTGAADVGFTTEALIDDVATTKLNLYWKRIDPADYQPIKQGLILLKHAANNKNAQKFVQYISTKSARDIFKQYGYLGI